MWILATCGAFLGIWRNLGELEGSAIWGSLLETRYYLVD